jgi:hypothetical protein
MHKRYAAAYSSTYISVCLSFSIETKLSDIQQYNTQLLQAGGYWLHKNGPTNAEEQDQNCCQYSLANPPPAALSTACVEPHTYIPKHLNY